MVQPDNSNGKNFLTTFLFVQKVLQRLSHALESDKGFFWVFPCRNERVWEELCGVGRRRMNTQSLLEIQRQHSVAKTNAKERTVKNWTLRMHGDWASSKQVSLQFQVFYFCSFSFVRKCCPLKSNACRSCFVMVTSVRRVCVYGCVCVCACVHACVCVCEREREICQSHQSSCTCQVLCNGNMQFFFLVWNQDSFERLLPR